MTEQIWANELRIFRETSPRSGTADGPVFTFPCGPAASARRVEHWGGRIDCFRQPLELTALHEYHEGKMTLSVGIRFIAWLLSQHAYQVGDDFRFDRNVESPTFCLEVMTESDGFRFRGVAFHELQLAVVPPELVTLDLSFQALDRQTIEELTEATADLYSPAIAARECGGAYTATTWGADPRVDNFFDGLFGVQFYLTRRNLSPAMFEPDGRPTRFTADPWRCIAEITCVSNALTLQAKIKAEGRFALFIGADGASLDLIGDRVSFFSMPDPVKATDFREESLVMEVHPDPAGSLLTVRDNSGLMP